MAEFHGIWAGKTYQTHEMWAACIDMELPVGFEITDNTCYKAAEYSIMLTDRGDGYSYPTTKVITGNTVDLTVNNGVTANNPGTAHNLPCYGATWDASNTIIS